MTDFNIETKYTHEVHVIRLMEDKLVPDILNIEICFGNINSSDNESVSNRLQAIDTWFSSYLNHSIIYSVETDINTEMLEGLSNNLVLCPDEPWDFLLGMLIYSKVNAFVGNDVVIKQFSLASKNHGFSQVLTGDVSNALPTMDDWVGPRQFHKTPWWNRTDSSMVDIIPEPHENLADIPELGVELVYSKENDQPAIPIKKPGWKPRIITNDE